MQVPEPIFRSGPYPNPEYSPEKEVYFLGAFQLFFFVNSLVIRKPPVSSPVGLVDALSPGRIELFEFGFRKGLTEKTVDGMENISDGDKGGLTRGRENRDGHAWKRRDHNAHGLAMR